MYRATGWLFIACRTQRNERLIFRDSPLLILICFLFFLISFFCFSFFLLVDSLPSDLYFHTFWLHLDAFEKVPRTIFFRIFLLTVMTLIIVIFIETWIICKMENKWKTVHVCVYMYIRIYVYTYCTKIYGCQSSVWNSNLAFLSDRNCIQRRV